MRAKPIEILAPAGSPEAMAAAVESGADAVYLGLKQFNARGNAINFSIEDLERYVPLAHQHGTRVYVTFNTLVKMNEMEPLLAHLASAVEAGIDGVILQDIGLGRMIQRHFPNIRRHASTQMAIHNLEGVRFCVDEGFERVVLARELTLAEISKIREAFPPEVIELEVFCHGAMCYTYSGMCFFSGSVGGRSGNRGECAYTCRKGYKILNDTPFPMAAPRGSYNNYLFSMKDMNTLDVLPGLVDSGIDSLKIEGRRKGPAYVSASVRAYRERLEARKTVEREKDLQLAFGRQYTKAFYQRGQFGDAPIDLTATGTNGLLVGTMDDSGSFVLERDGLQRFDGIRLVLPDGSETTLSLNHYRVDRGDRHRPEKGARIRLSEDFPAGTRVMWVRSQAVEQRYRPVLTPDRSHHVAGLPVNMWVEHKGDQLQVRAECNLGQVKGSLPMEASRGGKKIQARKLLFRFGDTPFAPGVWQGLEEIEGFIAPSRLKQLRRDLMAQLAEQAEAQRNRDLDQIFRQVLQPDTFEKMAAADPQFIVRLDCLELLRETLTLIEERGFRLDFVMRPTLSTPDWKQVLVLLEKTTAKVRLVLPMVLRSWDMRVISRRLAMTGELDCDFMAANPAHLPMFRDLNFDKTIHADFSIYHLNTWACRALRSMGVNGRLTLSLEDDRPNMEALLNAVDPSGFEVIAYTDTPLFIAEACSLAALYGGCPGAKACGHETLHIENEHGDRFQVRHDRCRSIVIGDNALSWSGNLSWFQNLGVNYFRADFTVRPYTAERVAEIMEHLEADRNLAGTHTENLDRILL